MNNPSLFIPWQAFSRTKDGKVNIYRGLELRPFGGFIVVSYREDVGMVVNQHEMDFIQAENAMFIKDQLATATVFSSIDDAVASYEYDPKAPTAPVEIT